MPRRFTVKAVSRLLAATIVLNTLPVAGKQRCVRVEALMMSLPEGNLLLAELAGFVLTREVLIALLEEGPYRRFSHARELACGRLEPVGAIGRCRRDRRENIT